MLGCRPGFGARPTRAGLAIAIERRSADNALDLSQRLPAQIPPHEAGGRQQQQGRAAGKPISPAGTPAPGLALMLGQFHVEQLPHLLGYGWIGGRRVEFVNLIIADALRHLGDEIAPIDGQPLSEQLVNDQLVL